MRQLRPDIRFSPFEEAFSSRHRTLVEVEGASFVVGEKTLEVLKALREEPATLEELAARIERDGGRRIPVDVLDEMLSRGLPGALFADGPEPTRHTPFTFKLTLAPERAVRAIAGRLTWLYAPPIVVAVLLGFVIGTGLALPRVFEATALPLHWRDLPFLYVGLALSGFIHELGHAAACSRYGCPPGSIGLGLYLVFPVFYTDVTRAWSLSPRRRAVVDMGGLYFQSALIMAFGVYAWRTGSTVALRMSWITLFTMLHTLNPVFKMDGYWVFSDLGGLTNLHRRMREASWELVGRVLGRPRKDSPSRTRMQGWLLYVYLGLVASYLGFVGQFVVRAFQERVLQYPQAAGIALKGLAAASSRGDAAGAAESLGSLLLASVWPVGIGALFVALIRGLIRVTLGKGKLRQEAPGWRRWVLSLRARWALRPRRVREPFVSRERDALKDVIGASLGLSPSAAEEIADAAWSRGMALRRISAGRAPRRSLGILRALPGRVDPTPLWELESQPTPYVLALPLVGPAIRLLAELVTRTRRCVLIERTALTSAFLLPLCASRGPGRVELLGPAEMIWRNRAGAAAGSAPLTLVTFPDHRAGPSETTRPVDFLGQPHEFSLLEPLLFFRGASPVVTLRPKGGGTSPLGLVRYSQPAVERPREDHAAALLGWLASSIEGVVRELPAEVLGWRPMAQRTSRFVSIQRSLEAKAVEGLVRAWKKTTPQPDSSLHAWSLRELRRIQEGYLGGLASSMEGPRG